MTLVRSALFILALVLVTPPYALIALATFPLPPLARYRIISGWSRLVVSLAKLILRIDWQIEGRENLPARPSVDPRQAPVGMGNDGVPAHLPAAGAGAEARAPLDSFFGWGLALMSPIAINRSRGVAALRAIARRGRERLAQGFWVVVFPEGTRAAWHDACIPPGGALACASGAPVVPVAHNAGLFWPRNAFIKRPGTVTVRIGPPIEPANRDPQTVNELARTWIEEQQKALC